MYLHELSPDWLYVYVHVYSVCKYYTLVHVCMM